MSKFLRGLQSADDFRIYAVSGYRTCKPSAMAELDVTFRRLLRDLPQPMMHLAFPHRSLEPLGPVDPSVDRTRQLTTDNMLRASVGATEVIDGEPDLARLESWLEAAITAASIGDVFRDS